MKIKIGIPAALLAVSLLSSCASSERMVRMSGGALGSYEEPKADRVADFKAKAPASRRTAGRVHGLDQSLINLWPLFFRNADYYSVLWPMIDRDPYGFAVRPFYNQEGNEYAILFPLSAWNPVNGDGWALNAWWQPGRFAFFPLFQHSNDERLSYYGPFWTGRGAWGFFPLGATGKDWGYVLNTWWRSDRDGKLEHLTSLPLFSWRRKGFNHYLLLYAARNQQGEWDDWGIAPGICHFGDRFGLITLAWWELNLERKVEECGFFPLMRFSGGLSYLVPFWCDFDHGDQLAAWGVWPFFRFKSRGDQYFFPLYRIDDDGSFFISPVAGWQNTPEKSMLSVLGPLWYRERETPKPSDTQWTGLKEANFQLIAAMPYRGSKETYRMPVAGLEPYCNPAEKWELRKPLVWHRLQQIGIDARPEKRQDYLQLAEAIKAKREIERVDYWGFFPLFSHRTSARESRTSALLGLLGYRRRTETDSYFSFLTPLVFSTESSRNIWSWEQERREWLALPLLAGGEKTVRYPAEVRGKLSELDALSWCFGRDAAYNAFLRIRAGQLLTKLGVKTTTLPAYVCDRESMREFLNAIRQELPGETETDFSCTFFPFFSIERNQHKDSTVLWALLSGWGRDGWLSLPLLSGQSREGRSHSTGILFPLYFHQTLDENPAAPVLERKDLLADYERRSFTSDSFGLGMLYFRGRSQYRTPVIAGQAAVINQLLEHVRRWERSEASLAESRIAAAELLAALRSAQPEFTDRPAVEAFARMARESKLDPSKNPFRREIYNLSCFWAECDRSQKAIVECRDGIAKLLPELLGKDAAKSPATLAEAQALAATVNREKVTLAEFRGCSSLLWGSREAGDNSEWRILLGLFAEGSRSGADQESVSVGKLLYRHRRDGVRSETLFFPFVSMRRDGDDYRFNFLHRIFSTYREKGKSGGYFFYIPF